MYSELMSEVFCRPQLIFDIIIVHTSKLLSGHIKSSAEITTLALKAKNFFKISGGPAANTAS